MIRLSYGSGMLLGLWGGRANALPTTVYVMVGERCVSNCIFCAQRRSAERSNYLSRVLWPPVEEERLLRALRKGGHLRICLQVLHYPGMVDDVAALAGSMRKACSVPITANMVPVSEGDMRRLRDAGITSLGIALDAASPRIFDRVKGRKAGNGFTWEGHWRALETAVRVFGEAGTHFIVGLGESDRDLHDSISRALGTGAHVGLFRYTPVGESGAGEEVSPGRYHAVQLMLYLLRRGAGRFEFDGGRLVGMEVPQEMRGEVERGLPFLTSGCPGCNRPFYNERPGGYVYNLPRLPEGRVGVHILRRMEREGLRVEWV